MRTEDIVFGFTGSRSSCRCFFALFAGRGEQRGQGRCECEVCGGGEFFWCLFGFADSVEVGVGCHFVEATECVIMGEVV